MEEPELSEGARLLAAARTVPAAHHAFVKFLLGANDAVAAGMDAAALNTDRGAVRGAGSPVYHLRRRKGGSKGSFPHPQGLGTKGDPHPMRGAVAGAGRGPE